MGSERITRDEMLMGIARMYSHRSTCSRAQVGAVAARQGRVVVGSYNGAPAGMPHCDHSCNCAKLGWEKSSFDDPNLHETWCASIKPCQVSVHAEANAIAWTARTGGKLEGTELFTTMAPCTNCAMLIINAGIRRVVMAKPYRDPAGVELLQVAKVRVSELSTSFRSKDEYTSL